MSSTSNPNSVQKKKAGTSGASHSSKTTGSKTKASGVARTGGTHAHAAPHSLSEDSVVHKAPTHSSPKKAVVHSTSSVAPSVKKSPSEFSGKSAGSSKKANAPSGDKKTSEPTSRPVAVKANANQKSDSPVPAVPVEMHAAGAETESKVKAKKPASTRASTPTNSKSKSSKSKTSEGSSMTARSASAALQSLQRGDSTHSGTKISPYAASLTIAQPGEAVCREVACEGLATSGGYCRMHYIKNWKKIKRKDLILREKKLNQYIEELVVKYPDKYIEAIRLDLASDKDFAKVITDLDLDENIDDFEVEGESVDSLIDHIKRDFEDEGDGF